MINVEELIVFVIYRYSRGNKPSHTGPHRGQNRRYPATDQSIS